MSRFKKIKKIFKTLYKNNKNFYKNIFWKKIKSCQIIFSKNNKFFCKKIKNMKR